MLYNWLNRWKPKLRMLKIYYQDKDSSISCESFHFRLFLLLFFRYVYLLEKWEWTLTLVGRTADVSTDNEVRRFTYDVPPGTNTRDGKHVTDGLKRATDGWDLEK